MSQHTRDPQSLAYDTFLTWVRLEFLDFLTEHLADADFPTHIVGDLTDLTAKIDDYEVKLGPYTTLIDVAKSRNDIYGTAFKSVYAKLKQIKIALPTVDNAPDVLALFNLVKLPKTLDALYVTAQNALAYWATVAALPKYAPMIPDFTTLTALFGDFETARENFYATDSDRESAQNAVLTARDAINVIERGAFNWYRSRHIDGQDEWWTDTPWGCTSGGNEEPGEPEEELPPWPGPMATFTVIALGSKTVEVTYSGIKDATSCDLYVKEEGMADFMVFMAGLPMSGEDMVPVRRNDCPPSKYIEFKIIPYKGVEEGASSIAGVIVT